jgi:hypothetical protein
MTLQALFFPPRPRSARESALAARIVAPTVIGKTLFGNGERSLPDHDHLLQHEAIGSKRAWAGCRDIEIGRISGCFADARFVRIGTLQQKTKPRPYGLLRGAAQGRIRGLRHPLYAKDSSMTSSLPQAASGSLDTAGDWPVKSLMKCFSLERLSTYLGVCRGDPVAAFGLYEWNTLVTGSLWEVLGHVEVVIRNAVDDRLSVRHASRGRPGSWLDDPAGELSKQARGEIDVARTRLIRKGKSLAHGQIISELSLGFWRYLISKRYMALWPDIATGFPHAPNRAIATVERPLSDVHDFRNRLGHHQRIWSQPLHERHRDMLTLIGYVDLDVHDWVMDRNRVSTVLYNPPPRA